MSVPSRPIRVLELRSVLGTGGGPEKTILSGAALSDPSQYTITVCYIRDVRDSVFAIDDRAQRLGIDYIEVQERHSFDFSIWPVLRRLVRERSIDIVHSHDYKTNLYAWLLWKRDRVLPLATLHGYTGDSWKEQVYYAVDKRVVSRFPLLIAVSGDLRRELIRTGSRPERIIRVLNGIDERLFARDPARHAAARAAFGLRPDDIVLGAVGRLERQKRFDLLLEAFSALRRRRRDDRLRLLIAGDGSLREPLLAQALELGLGDACLLCGHRDDVAGVHHALSLFVQSSDYEGTPNAVLEAMALETPLVATDVGGTAELVTDGEHGLLVAAGDRDALVRSIERLLDDPEHARRLAVNARARVERELSFRARMAAVEAVYARLAAGRRAGRPNCDA
jgi:glycosyltransferase involved in cell wall biosynthesis